MLSIHLWFFSVLSDPVVTQLTLELKNKGSKFPAGCKALQLPVHRRATMFLGSIPLSRTATTLMRRRKVLYRRTLNWSRWHPRLGWKICYIDEQEAQIWKAWKTIAADSRQVCILWAITCWKSPWLGSWFVAAWQCRKSVFLTWISAIRQQKWPAGDLPWDGDRCLGCGETRQLQPDQRIKELTPDLVITGMAHANPLEAHQHQVVGGIYLCSDSRLHQCAWHPGTGNSSPTRNNSLKDLGWEKLVKEEAKV